MTAPFLPMLVLAPILIATIWFDLRQMRIPNWLVATAVVLAAATLPFTLTLASAPAILGLAAAVLVCGFLGFALRVVGGGDVKMLTAVMLFVPAGTASLFFLLLSAGLLIGIALVQMIRLALADPASGWAVLRDTRRFPMGLSIGLAGLALPWVAAVVP